MVVYVPGGQSWTTSTTGNSQMQAWVQGAIAKISSASDGISPSAPNPLGGATSNFTPISINTGTFPGTPAVRLIGDCNFLHRLCQLLLFCLLFRKRQLPRFMGSAQKNPDPTLQKPGVKAEESGSIRPGQVAPAAKGQEEGAVGRSARLGSGNAGQGYTSEEVFECSFALNLTLMILTDKRCFAVFQVKVLFLILVDLCRRTAPLAHPLPVSQVGSNNIIVRLHYIDGNYTVLPEVVEASLGPHIQVPK